MSDAYVLGVQARGDLALIARFLREEGGCERARKVVVALRQRLRLLASMPLAGRARPDLASAPGLRFWSMPPYLVAYLPARRPLVVVRILHGSRAPADLRDELADG